MRSLFMIVVAMFALAACDKTTGKVDLSGAQQLAVQICGFLPTAQTVANIFATGSPALDTASEVAAAVCQAVNTPRGAGQKPVVAGVVVEGNRVK
jgi:predicted small secreted protein